MLDTLSCIDDGFAYTFIWVISMLKHSNDGVTSIMSNAGLEEALNCNAFGMLVGT